MYKKYTSPKIPFVTSFLHFCVYFIIITSIKNHFYKMKRDIGMADYEKQVKQEFHTPSLYLCFVIGA